MSRMNLTGRELQSATNGCAWNRSLAVNRSLLDLAGQSEGSTGTLSGTDSRWMS